MSAQSRSIQRIFFDLSSRVKLRVTGTDRLRFLNGQLTNDVRKAGETRAIEACVLNAKGKMDAHLFVHADSDSFLLDAHPALEPSLQSRLERYIIADDVQIENVTKRFSIFHLLGPTPSKPFDAASVIATTRFGIPGQDLWIDANEHEPFAAELAKNFDFCDEECAEVFRVECGIPRWGRELTGEIIPVEANLEQRCIDYEKGCYIGQETISRMKMSGQRNKQLCGMISLNDSALAPGMKLFPMEGEKKEIGWITSAVRSLRLGKEIALGYVKRGFNIEGAKLDGFDPAKALGSAAVRVEVVDLPFVRSETI
jgi:folate-binding protein YgfZ